MSANSIGRGAEQRHKIRVLMVCLGNICRSPTAHGVLEKYIENKGLGKLIEVDSAGTSTYHIGDPPDPRSIAVAQERGYSLEHQIARQVSTSDFHEFDYVLAMDAENLQQLEQVAPSNSKATLQLLLDYSATATTSVPDPYFGGSGEGFVKVLELIEGACQRLLEELETELTKDKARQ